jgi:hypothetical protein
MADEGKQMPLALNSLSIGTIRVVVPGPDILKRGSSDSSVLKSTVCFYLVTLFNVGRESVIY